MKNTAVVTRGKPIAVLLQSVSGVSAINPLVAFYDIHGGKREVLFFYFVPDTTRDIVNKAFFNPGNDICVSPCWMVKWDSQIKSKLPTKNLERAFIPLLGHREIPR
jgi:hypothetical protein